MGEARLKELRRQAEAKSRRISEENLAKLEEAIAQVAEAELGVKESQIEQGRREVALKRIEMAIRKEEGIGLSEEIERDGTIVPKPKQPR